MNCIEEIPFCETFNPTWTEFKDFSGYLEKVSKIAKSGIFKVKIFWITLDNST
jgi:hypothetical protein